jgi:hypothetical protein
VPGTETLIGDRNRVRIAEPAPPRWIVPVAVIVTVLPIVVATVRALLDGWLAVGDNANMLIRADDVLTSNHPLLGTWSSASIAIGEDVNHPGPLLFDLLALPVKLGGSGGVAVGVALVGIASVAGIGFFASRVGGPRLACWSLLAGAALAWAMGSELLHDPWNPHVVLLPFLLLLVLVVAMARGDLLALPVAVGVASLVVQTHLTYALLAPALCAVGLLALAYRHRRAVLRSVTLALIVGALCWAQPVLDQLTGEGNLGALAGGVGANEESVGPALGARVVAEVFSTPPWWARPSFEKAFRVPPLQPTHVNGEPNVAGLPAGSLAALTLLVVAAAVVGAWLLSRRRRDPVASALLVVAAVASVLVTAAVVTQPLSTVGITGHQLRYLWPTAILVTVALGMAVAPRRWTIALPGALLAVVSVAALPASGASVGPANDSDVFPVLRALGEQLDDLEVREPIVYDTRGARFAEPWTPAVMVALAEHGIEFQVIEEFWRRQLGDGRWADGTASERLYLREGEEADVVPPGARRVAYVQGITDDEVRELRKLERAIAHVDLSLNDAGRAAHALEPLPYFRDAEVDVPEMVETGWLSVFVKADVVDVPESDRAAVERYADLWYRRNRLTVALFVEPIDEQG